MVPVLSPRLLSLAAIISMAAILGWFLLNGRRVHEQIQNHDLLAPHSTELDEDHLSAPRREQHALTPSRHQATETTVPLGGEVNASGYLSATSKAATVHGFVWGVEGELLARYAIGFKLDGYPPLAAFSNENGEYFIRLPQGSYRVEHKGSRNENSVPVMAGRLSVEVGGDYPYDIAILGEASVAGQWVVSIPGLDQSTLGGGYISLGLEVRRFWEDSEVLARGYTYVPREKNTREGAESPSPRPTRYQQGEDAQPQPEIGSFQISGLPAEVLVLRATLGEDSEGRPLFFDREIDLSDGDIVWAREDLCLADFTTSQ